MTEEEIIAGSASDAAKVIARLTDPDSPTFDLMQKIAACPHLGHCRSECNLITDPEPCVDYVGPKYRGLVVIGANPGIATTANQIANDARTFELQKELAKGSRAAFAELMAFIPQSMLGWRQMVSRSARDYLKYDIEEIAYINLVKCSTNRTSSDIHGLFTGSAKAIPTRCWDTHTREILRALKPDLIVALWQPIRASLERLGYSFEGVKQFGSFNGSRSLSLAKRYEQVKPIFDEFNSQREELPGCI